MNLARWPSLLYIPLSNLGCRTPLFSFSHSSSFLTNICFLTIMCFSFQAAAQTSPQVVSLQGRILAPSSLPLEAPSVLFTLEVLSPGVEECLLYQETHTIDMTGSGGVFALHMGAGTRGGVSFEDTSTVAQAFNNASGALNSLTCAVGNSYTPASNAKRKLRIHFDDGGGPQTVSQLMDIQAVPYALYADTLQGKGPASFLQTSAQTTQVKIDNLANDPNYNELVALIAGTSAQYVGNDGANFTPVAPVDFNAQRVANIAAPTAAGDAVNKTYSDTKLGGATLDQTGLANGQSLRWNSALSKWEVYTPSTLDSTKLPLAGGTMTGALDMGSQNILGTGHITMTSQRTIHLGTYTDAQETTLTGTLGAIDEGKTWYNSDDNQIKYWTGASAAVLGNSLTGTAATEVTANQNIPNCLSNQKLQMSLGLVYTYTCVDDLSQWVGSPGSTIYYTGGSVGIGVATPTTGTRLDITGTGATASSIIIPRDTVANRPTVGVNGMMRYASDTNKFEVFQNGAWIDMVGTATTVTAGNGSAGSPSMSFSGDPNTGFYSNGADTIGISSNGANVFNISSSSLSSPTTGGALITSGNGTAAAPTFSFAGDPDTGWFRPAADTLAASTAGSERVRIDSSGNVGIGTTTPTSRIHGNTTLNAATGDEVAYKLDYTTNKATSGNDTGLLINMTDTASPGTSLPLDIKVGGTSRFSVNNTGVATASKFDAPTASFSGNTYLGGWTGNSNGKITNAGSTTGAGTLQIGQSGEILTLMPDNVGVGTTTPLAPLDVYGNSGTTTTSSTINAQGTAGVANITVGSTAGFPVNGVMLIDSEAMTYSVVNGTTIDILARGQLGTTGATHANGATVSFIEQVVSKGPTTTPHMVITSSGNVGIGNATPSSALDVLGNITASAWVNGGGVSIGNPGNAGTPALNMTGNGSAGLFMPAADTMAFATNGSERARINSAGNVAIGTASPTAGARLDITGTGATASSIIIPRDTVANRPTVGVNGMLRYATDTNKFEGFQNGAWVDLTGMPSSGGTFSGAVTVSSGGINVTGGVDNNSGGITEAGSITGVGANITGTGALTVAAGGTNQNLSLSSSGTGSVNVNTGNGTSLSVIDGGASTVNYVTIKGAPAGNPPSIGTGGADANINLYFQPKGGGHSIFANGNVGVGTGTPSGILHMHDGAGGLTEAHWTSSTTGSTANDGLQVGINNIGGNAYIFNNEATALTFSTTATERMRIADDGKVGVGTLTPTSRIHGNTTLNAATGNEVAYQLDYTTNKATSGNDTGLLINMTDTASPGVSRLLDLQVGGASTFSVNQTGNTSAGNYTAVYPGNTSAPAMAFSGNGSVQTGFFIPAANTIAVSNNNSETMRISAAGNVGIGTTSPAGILDVRAPLGGAEAIIGRINNAAGNTSVTTLNIFRKSTNAAADGFGASIGFAIEDDNNTWNDIAKIGAERSGADNTGDLVFTPISAGTPNERMRIKANGNVGIGTTNPGHALSVVGTSADVMSVRNGDSSWANLIFLNSGGSQMGGIGYGGPSTAAPYTDAVYMDSAGKDLVFTTSLGGNERMRIKSGGNVGVGTTSPGARLDVTDTSTTTSAIIVPRAGNFTGTNVDGMVRYNTTSTLFEFRQNGAWVNYTTVSDGRLKTNIEPVTQGLDIVNRLNPVFYDWDRNNPKATSFEDKHQVGFIAQEVEKVLPEVVNKGGDGYRSLEYGKMVAVVVDAVKTLYSRVLGIEKSNAIQDREISTIDAKTLKLEAENAKLKQENAAIKTYLCAKDPTAPICK